MLAGSGLQPVAQWQAIPLFLFSVHYLVLFTLDYAIVDVHNAPL